MPPFIGASVMTLSMEDPEGLRQAFRFCPRCSTPGPRIKQDRELHCPHCGLRFFFNTAAAAGAFVFVGDQLLLCVRAHEPGKGLLDVPGGFIEFDESVEEGLRREIAEELSIEVSGLRYFTSAPNDYRYAGIPYKTADLFFVCEALNGERLRAADDVAEVVLVDPLQVKQDQFAFASTRNAFDALLKMLKKEA